MSDEERVPTITHGAEWLRLLLDGPKSTKEIAEHLGVSERTAQREGVLLVSLGWPLERSHSTNDTPSLWSVTSKAAVSEWLGLRR